MLRQITLQPVSIQFAINRLRVIDMYVTSRLLNVTIRRSRHMSYILVGHKLRLNLVSQPLERATLLVSPKTKIQSGRIVLSTVAQLDSIRPFFNYCFRAKESPNGYRSFMTAIVALTVASTSLLALSGPFMVAVKSVHSVTSYGRGLVPG
jgi:hypothetical protein